jgi:hypothetical protein
MEPLRGVWRQVWRQVVRQVGRPAAGGAGLAAAVLALHLLLPVAAAAAGEAPEPVAHTAQSGEFCPLGGWRPTAATPWSGAAFGAAVLAIAWTARRRDAGR